MDQGREDRTDDIDREYATLGTGDPNRAVAYGNNNSVYITVEADTTTVSGQNGTIVDVRGVTTGIRNTSIRMDDVGTGSKLPSLQNNVFYAYNSNGYVTYAVVIGRDGAVNDDFAYILSGVTERQYISGVGYVDTYDAIVDGEETEIQVIAPSKQSKLSADNLYQVEYDADGYVIEGTYTPINKGTDNTDHMNTTENSDRGYAWVNDPTLTLKGATLYTQSKVNNNYVILDEDVVFYVENEDGDYDRYTNPDSALDAAAIVTKNVQAGDVIDVTKLIAICDGDTGYATTVIIDLQFQGQGQAPATGSEFEFDSVGVSVASDSGIVTVTAVSSEMKSFVLGDPVVATFELTHNDRTYTYTQNLYGIEFDATTGTFTIPISNLQVSASGSYTLDVTVTWTSNNTNQTDSVSGTTSFTRI